MEASSAQSSPLRVFSLGSQSGMSSGPYFVSVRSVMADRLSKQHGAEDPKSMHETSEHRPLLFA
jgi:hypothetical protein